MYIYVYICIYIYVYIHKLCLVSAHLLCNRQQTRDPQTINPQTKNPTINMWNNDTLLSHIGRLSGLRTEMLAQDIDKTFLREFESYNDSHWSNITQNQSK